jgi:hypothetical protein
MTDAATDNGMSGGSAFDVVIVPDFSGRGALLFEVRTLFFLASWAEHAGAARRFPLHIACIGEPPVSVRDAAARYGAEISVHEPVGVGSVMSNKLRGLEVVARTDQILLVDVDVLVLDDISGLSQLAGSIAASPMGKPPLRMRHWRRIYEIVGVEMPVERISSMFGNLLDPELEHLRAPEQNEKLRNMVPMYHGGVVFAPMDAGLRSAWEETFRAISSNFVPDDPRWRWVPHNDEVALVTAVEKLKRRGVTFTLLPDVYHTQWPQMWGRYRWGEPKMFHLRGFLRGERDQLLEPAALAQQIHGYCDTHRKRHLDGDNRFKVVVKQNPATFAEFTERLEEELLRLLHVEVAPALESAKRTRRAL